MMPNWPRAPRSANVCFAFKIVLRLLHVLTKENDALPAEMIGQQRDQSAGEVVVIDLNQGPVDYAVLLQEIFAADSVEVW